MTLRAAAAGDGAAWPTRGRGGRSAALKTGTSSSDAALLRRYAEGDPAAARELTGRHAPRIHALARRMLGDASEAEDVTQETMLRMWTIAPDWREGGAQVGTWAYRVAHNLCIDRLRRRRRSDSLDDTEIAGREPDGETAAVGRDRVAALEAALATLPARQRSAVILRHLEERANPEIAEILETSVEAVESLLKRGRQALAARLAPMRDEFDFGETQP